MKKRRSHSGIRRARNFFRWWRLPGQDLLRHEARWARRSLLRPPGIFWLLLPLMIKMVTDGLRKLGDAPNGSTEAFVIFTILRHLTIVMVAALLWWSLMRQRTFLIFSRQKLHDLALSLYTGRQFWPALITAPIIVPAAIMLIDVLIDVPGMLTGGFVMRELLAFEFFLLSFKFIVLVLFTTQIAAGCFANPNPIKLVFSMAGYAFQLVLIFGSMIFLTCCITVPAFALSDAIEQDGFILHLFVTVAGGLIFLYFAFSFYMAIARYNLQQLRQLDFLSIYTARYESSDRNRL